MIISRSVLAPPGTTGNNTHGPVGGEEQGAALETMYTSIHFVVEAIGATPTVTFKLWGSVDDGANYHDVLLLPSDSDTTTLSVVRLVVGPSLFHIAQQHSRNGFTNFKLSVYSNTNVTYRAELVEASVQAS